MLDLWLLNLRRLATACIRSRRLRLLDLRRVTTTVFWSRNVGLLDLRSLRTAYVRSSNIRLAHLRLGWSTTAVFRSRSVRLLRLRLRLRHLTATTIGVNTRIVGIHAAADDLVVAALIAGSYLSGARACIATPVSVAARAPHVVVIDAAMDAVVAIQCAVVDAAIQDAPVDRHVAISIIDVNVVDMNVRTRTRDPNRAAASPAVVKDAAVTPVAIMVEP